MSQRGRVYGFVLIVVFIVGGGYVLNDQFHLFGGVAKAQDSSKSDSEKKDAEAVPVELATAELGEISSFISSTGNLRALRDIVVATQVEGIIARVLVEEGDFVEKDRLLCELDDAQFRIDLELARQRLAQAKLQMEKAHITSEKTTVQIENARTEYERYKRANEDGLVSETEVATRKYTLDELEHDLRTSQSEIRELGHRVDELEAEIRQSELQISRTEIRAPFAGHITGRTVELGQRVRSLDPLFNLASFNPLYADVFLSEREAGAVRPGQVAMIRLGADATEQVQGRVKRISPIVDQSTGTVKATVEISTRQPGFKPGSFVRVALETDTQTEALLIPKKAVVELDGETFVFVAGEGSEKAERVKVITGYESEGVIQIRSGLAEGQKVLVAGQGALKEGSKIKVIG